MYRSSALGKGSASAPNIINPVEHIMILYKHQWERIEQGVSHIGLDSTNLSHGFWMIEPNETSPHLARLPFQVPTNLIRLLAFKHDIVLDAFGSGGNVSVAAKRLGNPFISIESSEQDGALAKERLSQAA